MNCHEMQLKLPDQLFESEEVLAAQGNAEVLSHLADCGDCREQLAELRATMSLMDEWDVPEPNPYFLTRFGARLEEERQTAPANWFERMRARLFAGASLQASPHMGMRPVAAMAMTVVLLIGGGTYLGLSDWDEQPAVQPTQTAVVHDLQTLDSNSQLLDQLESLSNN